MTRSPSESNSCSARHQIQSWLKTWKLACAHNSSLFVPILCQLNPVNILPSHVWSNVFLSLSLFINIDQLDALNFL